MQDEPRRVHAGALSITAFSSVRPPVPAKSPLSPPCPLSAGCAWPAGLCSSWPPLRFCSPPPLLPLPPTSLLHTTRSSSSGPCLAIPCAFHLCLWLLLVHF